MSTNQPTERKQEIKKYQVWYRTENGKVTSPFIVLSNNRMNAVSPIIIGAPVILGQADPMRWYQIPFVGACGKPYYVDVCNVFSIQTSTFEDRLYSATLSFYSVGNTDLHSYLEDALGKIFDISVKSVNYDPVQTEVEQQRVEQTAPAAQPIQLTINLNGVPFTASVPDTVTETQENTEPEIVAETEPESVVTALESTVEETPAEPEVEKPKMCKAVGSVEHEQPESVSESEQNLPEPRRRKTESDNSGLTSFGRNELENYIINNHRTFGGNMSRELIASAMGVSLTTVDRHVSIVRNYLKNIFYRGGQTTIIPAELIPRFLIDYNNNKKMCFEKYSRYINNKDQLYGCVFRYKRALKQYATKCAVR